MRNLIRFTVIVAALAILSACGKQGTSSVGDSQTEQLSVPSSQAVQLTFTYGSEKEDWVKAVTASFNANRQKTASGKIIFVRAIPMGSGECIDTVLNGAIQADITSPASGAFIKLGNAQSRGKTGKDLIASTDNLLLSPVVIAMWKPMAEAIGWGKKPVGWSDILAVARSQRGWGDFGYSQWGQFKFGHTHPDFSNSGLISIFAEVYAATGKVAGLTRADLDKPETARYLAEIERSVVHYGSSTGFFGKKMFAAGPEYLSAAVLYENMVIQSYGTQPEPAFPVVAIYPKEGTFWSDHPVGVVEREWVTPERREAAKAYIAYLLARPQQEQAVQFGFRPAAVDVPLASPIDVAHGVNPKEPQTTLEVPGTDIMDGISRLWRQNKKRSQITLVFDTSGSMSQEGKIVNARTGALELLKALDDSDYFNLKPFNERILSNERPALLKDSRATAEQKIQSLFASGGTALYDTIATAFREQLGDRHADRIAAIVVLTDGTDTNSRMKLEQLLSQIRSDNELRTVKVFTIGYGSDADKKVLQSIANATQAKFYVGTPENIREVFRDVSTFF